MKGFGTNDFGFSSAGKTGGGGSGTPPIEFTVTASGNPSAGSNFYANTAMFGKSINFFLSGQYQQSSTYSISASGLTLIGKTFQLNQVGAITFNN